MKILARQLTLDLYNCNEKVIAFWTNFLEISELGNYNGEVSFEYSPPGASNLPIHIVLMPTD